MANMLKAAEGFPINLGFTGKGNSSNPKALAEFKAGKDSAINAFNGPVMKAAKGKANPKAVDETLRRLLAVS